MRKPVFARRLRSARLRSSLSGRELSAKAGLARSHVAMIESGARRPSVETAKALAIALGVSLDWLAGLSDELEEVA